MKLKLLKEFKLEFVAEAQVIHAFHLLPDHGGELKTEITHKKGDKNNVNNYRCLINSVSTFLLQ